MVEILSSFCHLVKTSYIGTFREFLLSNEIDYLFIGLQSSMDDDCAALLALFLGRLHWKEKKQVHKIQSFLIREERNLLYFYLIKHKAIFLVLIFLYVRRAMSSLEDIQLYFLIFKNSLAINNIIIYIQKKIVVFELNIGY